MKGQLRCSILISNMLLSSSFAKADPDSTIISKKEDNAKTEAQAEYVKCFFDCPAESEKFIRISQSQTEYPKDSGDSDKTKAKRNSGALQTSVQSKTISKIDALALNAFNLWNFGEGKTLYNFPAKYQQTSGEISPDNLFYVQKSEINGEGGNLVLRPTEGATVSDNILRYPEVDGRKLELKFSSVSPRKMKHSDAIKYCKKMGQRLPSIRELFDFCNIGTRFVPLREEFVLLKDEFPENRCNKHAFIWSFTLRSERRALAWTFNGPSGRPMGQIRSEDESSVQCVSANTQ